VVRERIAEPDRVARLRSLLVASADGRLRLDGGLCSYEDGPDDSLLRRRERRERRQGASMPAAVVTADGTVHEADVVDVSLRGVGLRTRVAFEVGQCLTVRLIDDTHLSGVVRHARDAHGTWLVGLDIAPCTRSDAAAWVGLASDHLYPDTRVATPADLDDLWDVLAAKYMNISGREPDEFRDFRQKFIDDHQRLAAAPLLGHVVLWPGEGTIGFLRTHGHTVMGHQIGRNPPGPGRPTSRDVLQQLYFHGFERAMLDVDCRWIAGFVNRV
jgi:hypothetical protein